MSDIEPRSQVSKNGVKGVGALAGGVGLLLLSALSAHFVLGLIAGGILTVVGFSLTGTKSDRTAGWVTAVAGIVTAVSAVSRVLHFLPNLGWLMWIPGVALIGAGVWSLFKFFRGVRSRS
jgi:hypothetical protein